MDEKKVYSNYPYSVLFDPIQRKLALDLEAARITIDEYRKIGRGLDKVANYLDHKDRIENGSCSNSE